ncbi:MAG: cyclic nucleotide-binding domain-containing protein [Hyphomicrobiaceae bacterium]|nr:cyclic nucleotide-binding domain-containing protein [Hyphomicrobiaceae bacterium]
MAIDEVIESLARIPVFAGLKPQQITEIGRWAERCAFHDGEAITRAGELGDGAYLILAGDASSKAGPGDDGVRLQPIAQGSLVGELAMFVEHVYGVTVTASGWVDCLKLERATLARQMRDDPDIADRIAAVVRNRLALVAAELLIVDRLLMGSIQSCQQVSHAFLPAPLLPAPHGPALAPPAWHNSQQRRMHARKSAQPRGRSWAQEARHAHSARREAGT